MLNNMSFLVGNSMSSSAKIAAIAKNSQLALINSDMTDNIVYDILQSYVAALSQSEISRYQKQGCLIYLNIQIHSIYYLLYREYRHC